MIVSAFLILSLPSYAQNQGLELIKALEKENWPQAYTIAKHSHDPFLYKLYQWKRYQDRNAGATFHEMSRFINENPNWPDLNKIQINLEKTISFRDNPVQLSEWFASHAPISVDGVDYYARSLLRQGKEDELKAFMRNWWATTAMSRDDQLRIFVQYKNFIPIEAHRLRFDQLLFNKNYSNARAVAKVLGEGYPELAEARIALAAQKPNVNSYIDKVPRHLKSDAGLVYERLKWRRKKGLNLRAIEILNHPPPFEQIANPDDWWRERHIIIRRLLEEGKYESAYYLAEKHFQKSGFSFAQAEWLTGWLALRFLGQPAEGYQRFESLAARVKTPVSKARAYYWQGRAAERLKLKDISDKAYNNAALYQTVYYGQLAGKKIGKSKALQNAAPPIISPTEKDAFNSSSLIKAAHLFHYAGHSKRATEFLLAFARSDGDAKSYYHAVNVALGLKRQHDVVKIAKEATQKGLFVTLQSYPVIGKYQRYASPRIEKSFLNALIRQESQFNVDAQSPAGALGLMQIMPATGRLVAKQNGWSHQTSWLTTRPEHNVRLGSQYLLDLLVRYDGNKAMAAAAYNAGPGRVDQWIKMFGDPRRKEVDIIDWIELMPIYETRNYVQRILEGDFIYGLLPP